MANYDPKGLIFQSNGKEMMYCYPDCERESLRGWICYLHPDGQWVTLRKATDADLAAINAAVVNAHHGCDCGEDTCVGEDCEQA